MGYKLVIFDFDGTLADTFPWMISVLDEAADYFGFPHLELRHKESLRTVDGRQILKEMKVPMYMAPRLLLYFGQLLARDAHKVNLFQGVDALLEELEQRGTRLAMVSSNTLENVQAVLGPENTARISHFECGVSLFGKRSRFERVLRRSGVERKEAICVGDEVRDLEAAQAAKIDFGAVAWGYTHVDLLAARNPMTIFSQVEDILRFAA